MSTGKRRDGGPRHPAGGWITWFELFIDDPAKDLAFYKEAFDLDLRPRGDMPFWPVMTGDKAAAGIDGAISKPPREGMTQRVVSTMSAEDKDAATIKAVAAGATVVVPKQTVPGSGWLTLGLVAIYRLWLRGLLATRCFRICWRPHTTDNWAPGKPGAQLFWKSSAMRPRVSSASMTPQVIASGIWRLSGGTARQSRAGMD